MYCYLISDEYKEAIITEGGLSPILALAGSKDIRVKRNATGALLNLSHIGNRHSSVIMVM